ncbi:MAG: hypothetical protein ACLQDY_02785 [Streptosporangiaceae bacterium]
MDRVKPEDYPIEVLEQWKASREEGPIAQLKGMSGLTEDTLRDMIQQGTEATKQAIRDALAEIELIDPEAALILHQAARHINPSTADALYLAADTLKRTLRPGAVEALMDAAIMLDRASPAAAAEQIYEAARYLDERIRRLRGLMGDM